MFRSIGSSAFAIVLVQAINFLVPLAALPHISRAIGVHPFGLYAILLSYGNYVLLVSDFSFNVNGPLLVAQAQREHELRPLILDSSVLKLLLLVPSLLAFCVASWFVTDRDWLLIIAGAMIPVATTLTPRWIMYSLNQIYAYAAASIVTKGAWFVLVILMVRGPADVGQLLVLTAATQLLLCAICGALVWIRGEGRPRLSFARIRFILKRDISQFLAILTTSSLRDLGVVILSATTGPSGVSIYALADRVRFAVMSVVSPVSQSLFLITARHGTGDAGVQQRVRGLTNLAILAAAAVCGIGVCAGAGYAVNVLGGARFAGSVPLLRIVALAPTFTALNSIMGVNTLLAQGFGPQYAAAQLRAVAFAAPTMAVLVFFLGPLGAAIGVLSAEIIMSVMLMLACRRTGVLHKTFALA